MAILLPNGKQSFTNSLGLPLVGGKVYTYAAGTNTPQQTFADAAGTIPNTNPVILDARGEATIFWAGAYKVRLADAVDATIWTIDNITTIDPITSNLGTAAGASLVGFQQLGSSFLTNLLARGRNLVFSTDFGAVLGNTGNQAPAIQTGIDYLASVGGGTMIFPLGILRITEAINLKTGVRLMGFGVGSAIHVVSATKINAFQGIGTLGTPLLDIHVTDLRVYGDNIYTAGVPSVDNGSAFNFQFVNRSSVKNCLITGFSDNATAFANGDYNLVEACTADQCGQSISFYATTRGGFGNKAALNTVTNNGLFNAIHAEGRASAGTADLNGTIFTDNVVDGSYGLCINLENSPYSVVKGNRVRGGGPNAPPHGIFLFGSYGSTVQGNVSTDNLGYGIYISANCGLCSVDGNTTAGNTLGSCIVTDGGGTASTLNVAMGVNSFAEGPATIGSANVSFRQRIPSIQPGNVNDPSPLALDWYEEGAFTPVPRGSTTAGAFTIVYQSGRFTRVGNIVTFKINLGWSAQAGAVGDLQVTGLPYASIAGDLLDGITVWNNGLPYAVNTKLQASIPAGGTLINIQTYTDVNGVAAAVPVPGAARVVAALVLNGSYLV